MLIDWFTVAAQLLNFLVLAWLLKRFLYRPILDALDAREERIAAELAEADVKKAEAQQERAEFLQRNEAFDQERTTLLRQATDEANAERERLLEQAQQDANALRMKRQEALRDEQQQLNAEITRRTREEVFAIARQTLTDLAGISLEAHMSEVFAGRLQALDHETKDAFAAAVKTSTAPVLVHSTFELPAEQRLAIQSALSAVLSTEISMRFETVPELVSGIELSAGGRKIAWSIADYLGSLEKSIDALLAPTATNSKPEAEPHSGAQSAVREQTE